MSSLPPPVRKKKPRHNMKGITRVDSDERNQHGYFVRIYHRRMVYTGSFSDRKLGGKRKALAQARIFRDQTYFKLGITKKYRKQMTPSERNQTGVVGVSRIQRKKKDQTLYFVYVVSWYPKKGTLKTRSFSVNKYGEKQAFSLACAFRKKCEIEMYGESSLLESSSC